MRVEILVAEGIVGNQVEFTTQELIILADLKDSLQPELDCRVRDSKKEVRLHPSVVENINVLLGKIVGDTKGLHQTHAELFDIPEENRDFELT